MAYYVDSSALVRLVVPDARSGALSRWWAGQSGPAVASWVARAEVMRTVRRIAPTAADPARALLGHVVLTAVTPAILETAAQLDPVSLRSLDAIHLASALDLGGDLEGLVTYDERLAAAARGYGVVVVQPR